MGGLAGVLLWPGITLLVTLAAGVVSVIIFRKDLFKLLDTRNLRIVWELVPMTGFAALSGLLLKVIDIHKIREEQAAGTGDTYMLHALAISSALAFTVTLFNFMHTDQAEIDLANEKKKSADDILAAKTSAAELLQKTEGERDVALSALEFNLVVPRLFLGVVERKRDRLRNVRDREGLLAQMDPRGQIVELLLVAHRCFTHMVSRPGQNHYVRVVLFCVSADRQNLEIFHGYDGTPRQCVSDPERLAEFLRFQGKESSLAVAASRNNRQYLVSDAREANDDPNHPFNFLRLNPHEQERMKSVAAFPIWAPGRVDDPVPVLVVNTSLINFFTRDAALAERLEMIMTNLAHRLQLEFQLLQALDFIPGGNAP